MNNNKTFTAPKCCTSCGYDKHIIKMLANVTVLEYNGKRFSDIKYRCMRCNNVMVVYDKADDVQAEYSRISIVNGILFAFIAVGVLCAALAAVGVLK